MTIIASLRKARNLSSFCRDVTLISAMSSFPNCGAFYKSVRNLLQIFAICGWEPIPKNRISQAIFGWEPISSIHGHILVPIFLLLLLPNPCLLCLGLLHLLILLGLPDLLIFLIFRSARILQDLIFFINVCRRATLRTQQGRGLQPQPRDPVLPTKYYHLATITSLSLTLLPKFC